MDSDAGADADVGIKVNAQIGLDVEAEHHHDGRAIPMIEVDWEYDGPGDDEPSGLGTEVRYRCPECSEEVTVRVIARSDLLPSVEPKSRPD